MNPTYQPSEGAFIYLLGLVVIATQPGRFWFGLGIAILPVTIGILGKTVNTAARWHRP